MKKLVAPLLIGSMVATAGCQLTPQDQANLGLVAGAGAGFLTADALNANPQWTVLLTLAGAAAGQLVARNAATNQCAYSNGDGTYTVAPC